MRARNEIAYAARPLPHQFEPGIPTSSDTSAATVAARLDAARPDPARHPGPVGVPGGSDEPTIAPAYRAASRDPDRRSINTSTLAGLRHRSAPPGS